MSIKNTLWYGFNLILIYGNKGESSQQKINNSNAVMHVNVRCNCVLAKSLRCIITTVIFMLLLCSHSPKMTFPPGPQWNVSIVAVHGAVCPLDCHFHPKGINLHLNPLYTGWLLYCYMLDESIYHFRGVKSILSFIFYFGWKILLANNDDPAQMPHNVVSGQSLHCLPMTLLRVSRQEWVKS